MFKLDDLEPSTCLPRVITSDSKGSDCLNKELESLLIFFLTAMIVSKTPGFTVLCPWVVFIHC